MHQTADIIIIGAGITGCALFHALAKQNTGKILLIEKQTIASGTTGQSGGLIRRLFQPADIAALASDSFAYYQRFQEETGYSCDFIKTGCQYWLPDQTSPIVEEDAGCINTTLACESWVKSALSYSASLVLNQEVAEILIHNQQVVGVKTNQTIYHSPQIVVTAGAWSVALLKPYISHLSIVKKNFYYHYYYQQQTKLQTAVIDLQKQIYLIPTRTNKIIAGSLNDDDQREYSGLDPSTYISTHMAVDAFSDNEAGILSAVENINGFYISTGWSGGGIKIAPAVAQTMVNILARGVTVHDYS